MSAVEYEKGDSRSSVKISENAKGEPAVEVKAYTHDAHLLDDAREKAVEIYKATRTAVRVTAGGAS